MKEQQKYIAEAIKRINSRRSDKNADIVLKVDRIRYNVPRHRDLEMEKPGGGQVYYGDQLRRIMGKDSTVFEVEKNRDYLSLNKEKGTVTLVSWVDPRLFGILEHMYKSGTTSKV